MTHDESKIMQGVAILMMIFFHLPHNVEAEFGPVLTNFSLANNPVPLYTLLSGYGFYKVYCRKQKDNHRVSRCLRLYSVYWITLTVFLAIGVLGGGIFAGYKHSEYLEELYRMAIFVLFAFLVCLAVCTARACLSLDNERRRTAEGCR